MQDVMPYQVVDRYQCFERLYCLHLEAYPKKLESCFDSHLLAHSNVLLQTESHRRQVCNSAQSECILVTTLARSLVKGAVNLTL